MLARRYNSVLMAGQIGSGKSASTDALAAKTGWEKLSIGDMVKAQWPGEQSGISLDRFCSEFPDEKRLSLMDIARDRARNGNVVIDERFPAGYPDSVLKVLLYASPEVRLERIRSRPQYAGLTDAEIMRSMELRDEDVLRLGLQVFGIDYRSPKHYYVSIRTDRISTEEIVGMLSGPLQLKWIAGAMETTTAK